MRTMQSPRECLSSASTLHEIPKFVHICVSAHATPSQHSAGFDGNSKKSSSSSHLSIPSFLQALAVDVRAVLLLLLIPANLKVASQRQGTAARIARTCVLSSSVTVLDWTAHPASTSFNVLRRFNA